ncbi:glutamyl-tRNA reductase [Xanthovirga aplysinae]|uniref:glutamyl-tRNA reductase n=1 Tax=Xanthovirga aplysinae TaxID=2529853 RepID=UPI0012BC6269|nr:glutamyl-tRNA reductase [Xanthovirga aplysinae]MTI31634.1 glutamyl-tRNA reductase [Xanthovirga aplysinae]
MHNTFKAISLSYKEAPLEIREQVALSEDQCKKLLKYFKEFTNVQDALILSTCNRTEIYYSSEEDLSKSLLGILSIEKEWSDSLKYKKYFTFYNDHQQAVDHLFRVAIGLEAQVVGDLQISNQVKRAYQASADEQMAGPLLHRLMHTIFFTNKRTVQETAFRDGAASVSYAATELVEELTSEIINPRILVIGVGEIGADVCRNFIGQTDKEVYITNRTFSKAESLAAECGLKTIPFEQTFEVMKDFDVIISSVAAEQPFITKSFVESMEILSFKYFIDLSVPRSIETSIEDIPGALVYNVDNIRNKASQALEKRIAAIPQVEKIIEESKEEFQEWTKEMIVSPTIKKLKNALEQIRLDEIKRYTKNLNREETAKVEKITKNMMQKVIKLPVLQLKAACKRGEADTLVDVLNDLFDLEKAKEKV